MAVTWVVVRGGCAWRSRRRTDLVPATPREVEGLGEGGGGEGYEGVEVGGNHGVEVPPEIRGDQGRLGKIRGATASKSHLPVARRVGGGCAAIYAGASPLDSRGGPKRQPPSATWRFRWSSRGRHAAVTRPLRGRHAAATMPRCMAVTRPSRSRHAAVMRPSRGWVRGGYAAPPLHGRHPPSEGAVAHAAREDDLDDRQQRRLAWVAR